MRGRAHDPETKAKVMAALLSGQGVAEVARDYKLDKSIVSRWKSTIPQQELQSLATQKEIDFSSMIADYLAENLKTLKAQSEFFREKDWLKRQPASELAVLHGVVADKTVRLLEAAERAAQAQEAAELP